MLTAKRFKPNKIKPRDNGDKKQKKIIICNYDGQYETNYGCRTLLGLLIVTY